MPGAEPGDFGSTPNAAVQTGHSSIGRGFTLLPALKCAEEEVCMPTCKNCSTHFRNWQQVAGKLRNLQRRKYCLECSPFGGHNTRHPMSKMQREIISCGRCGRVYVYDHGKGHGRSLCNSCHVNTRRFEVKRKAIKYKGGACSECGYNRCAAALVFHHIDPADKGFALGGRHSLSWPRLRRELDKCVLLCMNCHAEIHASFGRVA